MANIVLDIDTLIDIDVPLHMREEFWLKYGPELIIPSENLNPTINNCPLLYAIARLLLDRYNHTGRDKNTSGIYPKHK